jgi:hypothetical protein
MRVAVINYTGTVGKTTVSAHLLAPRMHGAPIFSIETVNQSASDLGLDSETMKGDKFGSLFKKLLVLDEAIIDVGASNVEDFLDRMMKYEGAQEEIDFFVVPVVSGGKEQRETIQLIDALAGAGVPKERVRVLFNRVDTDVDDEFKPLLGYAKLRKTCIANPEAAIFETEIFDLLSAKRLSIGALMADETDYRAQLKAIDKADKKAVAHLTDMHALKLLAKSADRQLDRAFAALFA